MPTSLVPFCPTNSHCAIDRIYEAISWTYRRVSYPEEELNL